ncbi:ABC transporter ATP-binding protein [bacterium]|nr:ABC transporter ATP-binding protein [bacterium]
MKRKVILEARDLSKKYYQGKSEIHALSKINLKVNEGEILVVVGPSGAGKSTLLHIIGTLDHPTEGEIIFDNQALGSLSDSDLAKIRNKKFGFVFQSHHLLPEFTALENVMMPGLIEAKTVFQRRDIGEKAHEILKELGLGKRISHRPGELSGGEQQRVAVARALINDPFLILCDEPTGNLDKKTGEAVWELLLRLSQENHKTLIIVTHNEELGRVSEKILHMQDGRVI